MISAMPARALLSILLLSGSAAAAAPAATPVLRAPVEIAVMRFAARIDDGRVILTWRRYKRDDFKSYQLVKSADASPQYPDVHALFYAEDAGVTTYQDGKLEPGTWHYRVCIVTRFGDRWVSPVVDVVVKPEDIKRAPPTEADFE